MQHSELCKKCVAFGFVDEMNANRLDPLVTADLVGTFSCIACGFVLGQNPWRRACDSVFYGIIIEFYLAI